MHKKFKITIDGRAYTVDVEEIVGDAVPPHLAAVEPAVPIPVTASAPDPEAAAPAPALPGNEVAPLAGVIDSIAVKVGDKVAAGQLIAVIEAMKMKTDVFAKNAGTVASVAVKPGQSVDGGQALLSLA